MVLLNYFIAFFSLKNTSDANNIHLTLVSENSKKIIIYYIKKQFVYMLENFLLFFLTISLFEYHFTNKCDIVTNTSKITKSKTKVFIIQIGLNRN